MNRPLFDSEHLRIAAEVRAKASRQRWLNLAATLLAVLIMMLAAFLPIFAMAHLTIMLMGR